MTVSAARQPRVDYVAAASQTTFPYPFQIYESTDLEVYQNDALITAYTVSGVGDPAGGNVILATGATAGDTLAIRCNMPLSQGVDYVELDAFPAETHERALDKLTIIAQQHKEELDRKLGFPASYDYDPPLLPEPIAGKYLQWSAVSPPTLRNSDATDLVAATEILVPVTDFDVPPPLPSLYGGFGKDMSEETGFVFWKDGVPKTVGGTVDVSAYSTGGTGTSGDPWTGWDTAITWAGNTVYCFRPGVYRVADGGWAIRNVVGTNYGGISLLGSGYGTVIYQAHATNPAVTLGGDVTTPTWLQGVTMRDMVIVGDGTGTGLYVNGVLRSHFSNVIVATGGKGVHIKGSILSTYQNIRVSDNLLDELPISGLTPGTPTYGFYTEKETTNTMEVNANDFAGCYAEGCSVDGFSLGDGYGNRLSIAAEGCGGKGVHLRELFTYNTFDNIYCETNTGIDLHVESLGNTFIEAYCADGNITVNQRQNTFINALADTWTITSDGDCNSLQHCLYVTSFTNSGQHNEIQYLVSTSDELPKTQITYIVARPTTEQLLGTGAWTAYALGTEDYDTLGEFSGNTFTPKGNGAYSITAQVAAGTAVSGQRLGVQVLVSGVSVAAHLAHASQTGSLFASVTKTVRVQAGDPVTVKVYQDTGSDQTLSADGSIAYVTVIRHLGSY